MTDRPRGLYEVLITEAIASQLSTLGDDLHAIRSGVRSAEAPDRLALHLGRIVQRAIAGVDDTDRVAVGIALARKLIEQIDQTISGSQTGSEAPIEPGTVLRAVLGRTPDGRVEEMPEPNVLGADQRPRMEYPSVRCAKSRRHRQGRRGVRELLEQRRFRPV